MDKISSRQVCALIILEITGLGFVLLPQLGVDMAWRDGAVALILGTVVALFLLWLVRKGTEGYGGIDYFDCCRAAFGSIAYRLILWGFILKSVIFAGLVLRLFAGSLVEIIEGDIPLWGIMTAMALCSLYSALMGREVRGRLSEIFLLPFISVLLFVLVCGVREGRLSELLPVLTERGGNIIRGGVAIGLWFYPIEYVFIALPYILHRDRPVKSTVIGVIVSGVICILAFVLTLIRFGVHQMAAMDLSVLEMMYSVSLPTGFIERQEGLMLGIWTVGIFFVLGGALYNSGICGSRAFGIEDKPAMGICTLGALGIGLLWDTMEGAYDALSLVVTVGECIYLGAIPPVLYIAAMLEGKRV